MMDWAILMPLLSYFQLLTNLTYADLAERVRSGLLRPRTICRTVFTNATLHNATGTGFYLLQITNHAYDDALIVLFC